MIVVDTSIWVAALRSADSREAAILSQLLDEDDVGLPVPVRLELLGGASRTDRPRLRQGLSALPMLYPGEETWSLVSQWVELAAQAGQRFGVGDLMIGALAAETGSLVWSLEADFARMRRLKFVDLYEP